MQSPVSKFVIHPEGMPESSRWSERSADHRKAGERRVHPEGMPDNVEVFSKRRNCLASLRDAVVVSK